MLKDSSDAPDWQKRSSQSRLPPEKQAALGDQILNKPLNNHSKKLGEKKKKCFFLLWFAERTHRHLQTKNLAQMHLMKAIKSFSHLRK